MKTYVTGEVIKTLSEETQQRFKLISGCKFLNYLGATALNNGGYLLVEDTEGNPIDLRDMSGIFFNGKWELVQEPVTFMEAVNSGKRIRSVVFTEYHDYDELLGYLSGMCSNAIVKALNGKWLIEEDNINE